MNAISHDADLLPARMINEFVYCRRLFWLEYVEREFEESYDTVDGDRVHRRVDSPRGVLPDDAKDLKRDVTSVELSSLDLGVIAKIDLVRAEGNTVIPIDFKRGRLPENGPYDPERVQVCLQAMLLREHGYVCDVGRLYFAASKTSVDVPIDESLINQTLAAIAEARSVSERTIIPPPLVNSPKCGRCSLHAICLPDEVNVLRGGQQAAAVRPFAGHADAGVPVYVLEPGARAGLKGDLFEIRNNDGVVAQLPLLDVASLSLFGNAHVSSQAMRALLQRDVPIFYLSYGGWLNGAARSVNDHSLDLRIAQFDVVKNERRCLEIARTIVAGKIANQRTMVRRALGETARVTLRAMAFLCHRAQRAASAATLLGIEGTAAKLYFESFSAMLNPSTGFEVTGRNRRPPTDPVNAMLSFGYSMLAKEALAAVVAVGFDPNLGYYHRIRPGRPSLALDLMEEFRPLIVDSSILTLINTKEIRASHFERRGRAVALTAEGRKAFIAAIERRLRATITHPTFNYQVTYRRALNVQARLLARATQYDIPAYPAFTTR